MTRAIPLIRSAALFPMLRWLRDNGRPVEARLRAVDLGYVCEAEPERPVPLLGVFAFFRAMAASEGPDIGARVVGPSSLSDLGVFGGFVLGAATPRDALRRAAAALPRYSTHELLTFTRIPDGLRIRAGWSIALDPDLMHVTQQFTAALVTALCLATGRPGAAPRHVRVQPHPVAGLDHLRPWFGPALAPATGAVLEVEVAEDVLDAPLPGPHPIVAAAPPPDWPVLRGDLSCGQSLRLLVRSMASDPPVTIGRLAAGAGISARSLQRRLTIEGTCVRHLLDEARRESILATLPASSAALATMAEAFGYAGQSSLTRAVRRWTGQTPRDVRARAAGPSASERG